MRQSWTGWGQSAFSAIWSRPTCRPSTIGSLPGGLSSWEKMLMTQRHPNTLDPEKTALLVVDVQERFRAVMTDFDPMVKGCVRLVRTFRLLELPVLVTEQYPKGLGPTVQELKAAFSSE